MASVGDQGSFSIAGRRCLPARGILAIGKLIHGNGRRSIIDQQNVYWRVSVCKCVIETFDEACCGIPIIVDGHHHQQLDIAQVSSVRFGHSHLDWDQSAT